MVGNRQVGLGRALVGDIEEESGRSCAALVAVEDLRALFCDALDARKIEFVRRESLRRLLKQALESDEEDDATLLADGCVVAQASAYTSTGAKPGLATLLVSEETSTLSLYWPSGARRPRVSPSGVA